MTDEVGRRMPTSAITENLWTAEATPNVTEEVVSAVASEEGVSPLDLTPLYEVVTPEALDELFERTATSSRQGRIAFDYHGHRVVVTSDKGVRVNSIEEAATDAIADADTVVRFQDTAAVVDAIVAAVGLVADFVEEGSAEAGAEGRAQLPPLYETVDPEALSALFPTASSEGTVGTVSFPYCDCTVTVTDDQRVAVSARQSTIAE